MGESQLSLFNFCVARPLMIQGNPRNLGSVKHLSPCEATQVAWDESRADLEFLGLRVLTPTLPRLLLFSLQV